MEYCIIQLRSPPRWTKWSRGVRTRGLRVGAVGGPRPLLFVGPSFVSTALIDVRVEAGKIHNSVNPVCSIEPVGDLLVPY